MYSVIGSKYSSGFLFYSSFFKVELNILLEILVVDSGSTCSSNVAVNDQNFFSLFYKDLLEIDDPDYLRALGLIDNEELLIF